MKTKTFKIGEYCKGGIITVEIKKNIVTVIGKEWDYSKGSNKGSDQSGAKEFCRLEVDVEQMDSERTLSEFLHDLTTSYYTDEVMKYVESNFKLNRKMFW